MRILIHSDEYYPTAQACAIRMTIFADTFVRLGDEVVVIASSANQTNAKTEDHIERIIYSPAFCIKKKTTLLRMLNNLSFGITSVFSAIGAGKIDVVITTSPPPLVSISGWIIAKCKSAKLVYDVRDIWPDVALEMGSFSEGSVYCKVFKRITRFMYKHADLITTVSPGKVIKITEHLISCYRKHSGYLSADKVKLVGNGFDIQISQSAFDQSIVDQFELDQRFTCVYIGNIGLAQGLGAIMEIAAKTKHKDVQFLLFGVGAEREMLEKKASAQGLTSVKFCGALERSKVFTLLSRAKLSFIPLKNSNMKDSIPTKIYESLGIGCPVLLVAEGDSCRIVEEAGLGRWISPDKIESLTDAFDDIVDHYDEFDAHREEAIHLMREKYSRQMIAREFEQQLRELCEMGSSNFRR